jgi:hypothetical protein
MNTALPYLISAGIIASGLWVIIGTLSGAAYGWALLGCFPAIVGSISLCQTFAFDIRPTATAER